MAKIDDIWTTFQDARKQAERYFKGCESFCNSLAEIIKTDLGCLTDCQHIVETQRKEKQLILAISFRMPDKKTIYVRFVVRKSANDFIVKIEGSDEEFTVPENASAREQFAPIVDATFKWLENKAVEQAWK